MSDDTPQSEKLNFLLQDYWQKIQYLKDHFTRLWNRFNYFLTVQSALFGATVLSPDKYRWWVPIFAALVCALWYVFGAQDRYLVELYQKEIEQAEATLRNHPKLLLTNFYFVGQTENIDGRTEKIEDLKIERNFYQWRWKRLSTTKLPALFPAILFVIWMVILVVLKLRH